MALNNTTTSYGSVAKFFHWLIFLLIFFMVIYGFLLGSIPKDYQGVAYNIHKLTGLTILSLMILRALWAFINPKPALPFDTPGWQIFAERVVHYLIYIFVIIMPLSGWIGSSAAGKPPHLGNVALQLPIAQNKDLVGTAFDVHNTVVWIIIALVSIHVLAALYHYFIKKDHVLQRMLPGSRSY